MNRKELINRLKEFMANETRPCTIDFGSITPLYVYRMWSGMVAIDSVGIEDY